MMKLLYAVSAVPYQMRFRYQAILLLCHIQYIFLHIFMYLYEQKRNSKFFGIYTSYQMLFGIYTSYQMLFDGL